MQAIVCILNAVLVEPIPSRLSRPLVTAKQMEDFHRNTLSISICESFKFVDLSLAPARVQQPHFQADQVPCNVHDTILRFCGVVR